MALIQMQHLEMRPEPHHQLRMAALEELATYNHRSSGHPTKAPPSCNLSEEEK